MSHFYSLNYFNTLKKNSSLHPEKFRSRFSKGRFFMLLNPVPSKTWSNIIKFTTPMRCWQRFSQLQVIDRQMWFSKHIPANYWNTWNKNRCIFQVFGAFSSVCHFAFTYQAHTVLQEVSLMWTVNKILK